MSDWQPIETAPKTGETILVAHGNAVWADEWFRTELKRWQAKCPDDKFRIVQYVRASSKGGE